MHRILMDKEARLVRRLNPTILDVVKKEVIKLLAAEIIYPISDSSWVSPVQVVPKKPGITVMKNRNNELVPTRVQNNWRMCIDYKKLNQATHKYHFPLPFLDQVLEKLAGKSHYYFLDGYSGCMLSIFSDLLEDCIEVFIDDFTVYADTFCACLGNLARVLKRCIETDLVLNFEKCYFMIIEGIVLGHLVSSRGIKVDKAKINIITSLPNPASMREVRSFLGHAGFYRCFIKNFGTIKNPLINEQLDFPLYWQHPNKSNSWVRENMLTSDYLDLDNLYKLPQGLNCREVIKVIFSHTLVQDLANEYCGFFLMYGCRSFIGLKIRSKGTREFNNTIFNLPFIGYPVQAGDVIWMAPFIPQW
ncbi:Retrovirus-related Pol polyprotein from transposon opus, partial [Mucuna pruriens]